MVEPARYNHASGLAAGTLPWLHHHTVALFGHGTAAVPVSGLTACVLQPAESIRLLNLASTAMCDTGCEALAAALCGAGSGQTGNSPLCPQLEDLQLGENSIRDRGAAALSQLVSQSGTLTSLSLRDNEIGNAGAILLAGALKEPGPACTTELPPLQRLLLGGNLIGSKGISALREAAHEELRELELERNLVSVQAVERLRSSAAVSSSSTGGGQRCATRVSIFPSAC